MSEGLDPNKQNNTGGYSADYVKELREEAASWRTKFREAEANLTSMNDKINNMEKSFTIKSELSKRGINVDPSWVKLEDGLTPTQAVDKFIEQYPQFKTEQPSSPMPTPRPMVAERQNSNTPSIQKSDYQSVKSDPVARTKLREMYRSMLTEGNPGPRL